MNSIFDFQNSSSFRRFASAALVAFALASCQQEAKVAKQVQLTLEKGDYETYRKLFESSTWNPGDAYRPQKNFEALRTAISGLKLKTRGMELLESIEDEKESPYEKKNLFRIDVIAENEVHNRLKIMEIFVSTQKTKEGMMILDDAPDGIWVRAIRVISESILELKGPNSFDPSTLPPNRVDSQGQPIDWRKH